MALLMMVSMGARAEVKVLFGEKGTDKYEGKGGTIQVKQEESRDGGKVTVRLAFIPDKNYTFDEQSLEVYNVFSPESAATRALEIDGDALKLEEDKSTNPSEKHYHVDIDSKLALRVKEAQFISESKADPTISDDYSGTYYIGSVGYKEANTTTNYYLCPTEGWCYYQATNDFTGTDNGMPFLTTYQCRNGVYDVRKAIWVVDKYDSEYYTIKRAYDGKYIVFNGQIKTTSNSDRMRMHVEALSAVNDNALFKFVYNSTTKAYNIKPKNSADDRYWTTNGGNKLSLKGESGKTGGPSGFGNTAGIIGIYTIIDNNNSYFLEEAIVPPTFTINSDGSVKLSSLEGTSIRYTTDGTTPTAESTAYTAAIQVTSTMTSIKAIAIRTSDNKASDAVTLPLHTYTYYIVNKSGVIAIKQVVKQAEGKALGSMADIPADIRSPYLIGETVTFYSFDEAFTSTEQLTDEVKISATPQDDANIYVTYTTDHLSEKFLRLRGARAFNIVTNGEYAYDNGGTLAYDNVETNKTQTNHLWNISGGDPYAVQIDNLSTGKYLVSSTMPTLSLAGTATNNFILMEQSAAADAGSESVMLMKATGTGDLVVTKAEFQASPVNITTKYYLIDKAGKLIQGNIESESSELGLPDEWRSPLVSEYHYYKTSGYNEATQTYTPADPITSPFDADGGMIYVTYDVSDAVDLTGGKTYLLKFLNGVSFNQENGSDGILSTPTKAIYPYNNGDFNLYVYGQDQWDKQLGDGASTRSRWLWYIVSNSDSADPYHVIFKSFQNQQIKYNNVNYAGAAYLRTYKPEGYASVVTGTTYKNTGGYKDALPTDEQEGCLPTDEPTEYMILGSSISSMTLKTVSPVDGSRRIVDSFEQYWKNNPTVKELVGTIPNADDAILTGKTWHSYKQWAYSAPWGGGSKAYAKGDHWFQTISMGTGENAGKFTVEAVDLAPQVILIDQHGWEIMRIPLSDTETLRKYDSPMVEKYQWYPTALKTEGYHKYRVSDSKIKIYKYAQKPNSTSYDWIESGTYYEVPELDENDEKKYLYTSTTLADSPYGHITTPACEKPDCTDPSHSSQPDKVKTDFYVTYTVKDAYARNYQGAATEEAVVPSTYLVKQGGNYATFSGSGTAIGTVATKPSRESVTDNILWNLKPNFKIDEEMGFVYGTGDASKSSIESAYYAAGQNGFDPYNVQIQSKAYPLRYFTTNTTGSALDGGAWAGTSSTTVTLQNLGTKYTATGYDQTTLNITNATFMVVSDGNGNMRLMPRFDNSKVMQSFGTLAASTTVGDQGTYLYIELVADAKEIHSSAEITDLNGNYLLAEDFSFASGFTSLGTSTAPFTGTIDGQMNTFEGLTVPLVAYANGAIIRNIIIKGATISSGNTEGDAGAICCKADGATRIYNCGILPTKVERDPENKNKITGFSGSSVSGPSSSPRYVGGIVGFLDGTSRVINCYSYANITGGSVRAGIVGYNNYASKYNDLKTMVMNCMFYGDIDYSSGSVYPIYGGSEISNDYKANTSYRLNNYNYFLYEAPYSEERHIPAANYNCALAAEERFLVRFEFYRHLLNSTRELAAWYATDNAANGFGEGDNNKMAKWVLDKSIAPYPILKPQGTYPSIVNYDTEYTFVPEYNSTTGLETKKLRTAVENSNQGKDLGKTLSVTIQNSTSGGQTAPSGANVETASLTLPRIDIDTLNYNFNYDKVQLPYYNDVGTGNYTGNRVVTGWKITAVSGGAQGNRVAADFTTTTNYDAPNYNFADRDTYAKDLYSISGRVFSQGAYFNVPKNVTGITIEPYWGIAAYLSDACYDRYGYNTTDDNLTQVGGGQRYTNDTNCPVLTGSQKVYTTVGGALGALTGATGTATVYDYAVVLVGNYHHHVTLGKGGPELSSGDKPFTIMSIDLNRDNEPDYCLIYRSGKNQQISPIRFDFITVPGMVMAHKMVSEGDLGIPGNCCPKGWFEITTTGLIKYGQFEHSFNNKTLSPLIFMGGVIDQFVANNTGDAATFVVNTKYMLFGDNVWFKMFSNGCHMDKWISPPLRPVSITGGEYEKFYLSGYFRPDAKPTLNDNAECYIDGGKFGEVAGAGQAQIDGTVTWLIDHANITNFYGGGINAAKPVTGNISTTIKNSFVDRFCGGPMFGDMPKVGSLTLTWATNKAGTSTGNTTKTISEDRTVTTTATNCTFGTFFGAGFGGTSIYREQFYNVFEKLNYNEWNSKVNGTYKNGTRGYYVAGKGVKVNYEYEFFGGSAGNVHRLYLWYASFSLAQTNNVTSVLTGCTVKNNFYGGGSLGAVSGDATSTLTDCTIMGNVYGAGYSVSIPTVDVRPLRSNPYIPEPKYNTSTGVYEEGYPPANVSFTWSNVTVANNNFALDESDANNLIIKTNESLTGLGAVTGNVTLTLNGSTVGTEGDTTGTKGNVYGGGEESAVKKKEGVTSSGNTTVNLKGSTEVYGNVFGGGNEGLVEGSTTVNIQQ